MWFLADFETGSTSRDNKNDFDLGESGSREGIHQPEKPWLFEVLQATSDRCFGAFFPEFAILYLLE